MTVSNNNPASIDNTPPIVGVPVYLDNIPSSPPSVTHGGRKWLQVFTNEKGEQELRNVSKRSQASSFAELTKFVDDFVKKHSIKGPFGEERNEKVIKLLSHFEQITDKFSKHKSFFKWLLNAIFGFKDEQVAAAKKVFDKAGYIIKSPQQLFGGKLREIVEKPLNKAQDNLLLAKNTELIEVFEKYGAWLNTFDTNDAQINLKHEEILEKFKNSNPDVFGRLNLTSRQTRALDEILLASTPSKEEVIKANSRAMEKIRGDQKKNQLADVSSKPETIVRSPEKQPAAQAAQPQVAAQANIPKAEPRAGGVDRTQEQPRANPGSLSNPGVRGPKRPPDIVSIVSKNMKALTTDEKFVMHKLLRQNPQFFEDYQEFLKGNGNVNSYAFQELMNKMKWTDEETSKEVLIAILMKIAPDENKEVKVTGNPIGILNKKFSTLQLNEEQRDVLGKIPLEKQMALMDTYAYMVEEFYKRGQVNPDRREDLAGLGKKFIQVQVPGIHLDLPEKEKEVFVSILQSITPSFEELNEFYRERMGRKPA